MLFRKVDETNPRLLVVLIVGETPTGGINKTAFRNALDQVTWLSGWPVDPPVKEKVPSRLRKGVISNDNFVVTILGPTFSGSASSMRETLMAWRPTLKRGLPEVRIISLATALGHGLDMEGLVS
jgi:hypothetical protein